MKIKRVIANNRKKVFVLSTSQRVFEFPFSELTLKPAQADPITSVWIDSELAQQGFTYVL